MSIFTLNNVKHKCNQNGMGDGFDSAPSLGSLLLFILSIVLLNIWVGGRSGGQRIMFDLYGKGGRVF